MAVSAALAGAGCASDAPRPVQGEGDTRGLTAAERSVQPQASAAERPLAMAGGHPVSSAELHATLMEAAGAQALQELALDRMLQHHMRSRGWETTAEDIARERQLIQETISRDARVEADDSERLLASVRRNRGLGPHRFERLLARTAMLRRMVADEIDIEPEELRQAYEMKHGQRYRARVILSPHQRDALRLHEELLESADEQRRLVFIDLATRHSTDPSADRGGLLEPLSAVDPAYPASLRSAVQRLVPGEMSPVIAVDRGFAILLLEEIVPADGASFESAAPEIERQVRLRRERLAMDDLARRLLREAQITVFDRSLGWSWQNPAGSSVP